MPAHRALHGIIPPLLTPLTEDGEPDTLALQALVDFVVAAGAHGLFVLGTTGEAPHLTNGQRAQVVAAAVDAAAGRAPVLAGVIDTGTRRMLEQVEAAAAAGAGGVVATAPFYARADDDETAEHFRTLSRHSPVPVVAYHIPGRTGRPLSPEVLGRLAAEGVLAGVKDSSADVLGFRSILSAPGITPRFPVLTGTELLVDLALFAGAAGAVPGLANVDPAGFVRIYQAAQRGDWDSARAEQRRLRELFAIVTAGAAHGQGSDSAAYGGLKTALALRGVLPNAATAAPQTPVPPAAREEIKLALVKAGLL